MNRREEIFHEQFMLRLDKLTEALERGNAINIALLEMKVQESQKKAPAVTSQVLQSADDQIKAQIEAQRKKLVGDG